MLYEAKVYRQDATKKSGRSLAGKLRVDADTGAEAIQWVGSQVASSDGAEYFHSADIRPFTSEASATSLKLTPPSPPKSSKK